MYNTVLRRWPEKAFQQLEQGGNVYTTTIYVLVSAIQKIAREVNLPAGTRLYRGLGGDKVLPPHFFKRDARGLRGIVEWGFMSTTLDKATALRYSGVMDGRPLPAVFEIVSGAVDRGAVVSEFSQYPGEKECLFAPCSFLEPQSGEVMELTEHGLVAKFRIRLNVNLKSRTCEELVAQKKQMHISSFEYLLDELAQELAELVASPDAASRALRDPLTRVANAGQLRSRIMEQCREVLRQHQAVPAELYLDDCMYRSLVAESLEVKEMGKYKFDLWLRGLEPGLFVQRKGLRMCHREWNLMQELQLASLRGGERAALALELCRSKGLLRHTIDERNGFGEAPLLTAAANGDRYTSKPEGIYDLSDLDQIVTVTVLQCS